MNSSANIARVALDVPVDKLFDYRGDDIAQEDIGRRVLVPFGTRTAIGVVIERARTSEVPAARLKGVLEVLRDDPGLGATDLELLRFASDYYHHPMGEVVMGALPARLRTIRKRARRGAARQPIVVQPAPAQPFPAAPALTAEQAAAVARICENSEAFQPHLLLGVAGSGKTEVYLHAISFILAQGRQALALVPEIALTPQLEALVSARFPDLYIACLHSGLNESERLAHWLAAQSGRARIVLGTRLAVFTPMPELGIIVVDEEHDASFKQAEGFRYSARDLAVVRARQRNVPVVLGSATPALETYHNAITGRYALHTLTERIGAPPPAIESLDTRAERPRNGLSAALLSAIRAYCARGEQSLVFINRRGFAPVLTCRSCGWISGCHRCAAQLVLHLKDRQMRCHHCGHQATVPAACPQCGNQDLAPVGQGTQRVEAVLAGELVAARVLRIDRDSTRRRNAWSAMRGQIARREIDVLVGTQILAKGHDFPHLNLVGVLNSDALLYSSDVRAAERLFALLTQVAGRAGRGATRGTVLIQTEFPGHPLYEALKRHDYRAFADSLLAERRRAGFPPFVHQALLRAEAPRLALALDFLAAAAQLGRELAMPVTIYDPVPATLPRRAGRERAQLLVQSESRPRLQRFLQAWRGQLATRGSTRARWSLDVDPLEF
jgi:primosomal protein N' (replication factor Y) (superfamily II helicase)